MARTSRMPVNSKSILTALTVVAGVIALAPPVLSRWASGLTGPARTLISPVEGPVNRLLSISPLSTINAEEKAAALQVENYEKILQQKLAIERENEDLRRIIKELQRGVELSPGLIVKQFTAAVIGRTSDLSSGSLIVRAGARQGIQERSIAVTRGVQLVGRVSAVADRTSTVTLITDPAIRKFGGVVMLTDQLVGPLCQVVEWRRNGSIVFEVADGEFFDQATQRPLLVEPGMTVRLQDEMWPRSAQRFIVGKVISVEPKPEAQLRKLIVVRPEFDIARTSELTIRFLADAEATIGTPSGGTTP